MTVREIEIVAVLAAIAALWQQIVSLLSWPMRAAVVRYRVGDDAADRVLAYLLAHCKTRRGSGYYGGDNAYVRSIGRSVLVFTENLSIGRAVFLLRLRPLWFGYQEGGPGRHEMREFSIIRWSLDWDRFLLDVATWADAQNQEHGAGRHAIVHKVGAGLHGGGPDSPTATSPVEGMRLISILTFTLSTLFTVACLAPEPIDDETQEVTNCPQPNLADDSACPTQPQEPTLPTCAALGCVAQPSGSPLIWEPCTGSICYCHVTACTR